MRQIVTSEVQILLPSTTTETAISLSIPTIRRMLTAMLLISQTLTEKLLSPTLMTLSVLRRILTTTIQMRLGTAESITIPKRVRFISGRGTMIRRLEDLFREIHLRVRIAIRLV